ncbi:MULTISPECIES: ABC transporter permease [Rhodococcus]|uniref:ABC transporter permease n=1 Tax=Rhodococcus TaxID=1827 RepID=UPI001E430E3F|nr:MULTISPECIES: ABC transporter permease [Rhodococcus]MDJ0011829.1 ABC transporter permease [Rhodococcus erythropolis]
MIWVTWRHHRTSLVVSLGIVAALVLLTVISGLVVEGDRNSRPFGTFVSCFGEGKVVCAAETALTVATVLATMLPVFLGALVGVTVFSRDIEQGTHVLGLTQSVGRARWFWTRVLIVFVPLTLAAVVLGIALQWTRSSSRSDNYAFVSGFAQSYGYSSLVYPFFQSSGLVLGAYTFMALLLGAALALLVRSSIGAMALTMVAVIAILAVFQLVARPHYAEPDVRTSPQAGSSTYYSSDGVPPTANWELEQGYVDIRGDWVDVTYDECTWGKPFDTNIYDQRPEETGAEYNLRIDVLQAQQDKDLEVCLREQGVDHFEIRYHSDDRFWRFQFTEAALVLILSGLFLLPALWGLRRLKP